MTEETLFAALEKHCSQCAHFWSHPETVQMYCKKLQKRITARKKPCEYYCQSEKQESRQ